ncbi:hypothetical protein FQR65_LT03319 [Abscondita terminalis]|nr:hypothetical protein FQR65_LT03319 [Abscondita terminalis]
MIHASLCNIPLTAKEVPLYIRQSWVKVTEPMRAACICKTGVNPTMAYKSLMNTKIANNSCLKCYYNCLQIKLNLMEATTGNFVEKEWIRQIEGVTPQIFAKCNLQTKDEVDLCKKSFAMYLCIVHSVQVPNTTVTVMKSFFCSSLLLIISVNICLCDKPLTTKEVPLYIRQSWVKLTEPMRAECICKTGVNPTLAYKTFMDTEFADNPCLKCYYNCIQIKLNLIEATTGNFIEKEWIRQVEGVTPEIFAKCNAQTKDEVDLCQKSFDISLCIIYAVQVPKSLPPYSNKD